MNKTEQKTTPGCSSTSNKVGVTVLDPAVAAADSKNAGASVAFDLVYSDGREAAADGYEYPNDGNQNRVHFYQPAVYEISTLDLIPDAGVTEPFKVKIRLSERARSFTTEHIDVAEGKVTEIIRLEPVNPFHIFSPLLRTRTRSGISFPLGDGFSGTDLYITTTL